MGLNYPLCRVVGENLAYLAYHPDGQELACLLFGAAAWRCGAWDDFSSPKPSDPRSRKSQTIPAFSFCPGGACLTWPAIY